MTVWKEWILQEGVQNFLAHFLIFSDALVRITDLTHWTVNSLPKAQKYASRGFSSITKRKTRYDKHFYMLFSYYFLKWRAAYIDKLILCLCEVFLVVQKNITTTYLKL